MTTNKRSSASIFSYKEDDLAILTDQLMMKSFFLPVDILYSKKLAVHPIIVVPQETFAQMVDPILETMPSEQVHFEAGFTLACFSKFVGISARKVRETNKTYLIIKPWYGKNPYTPTEGDTVTATSEQLDSLLSFL